MEIKELVVYEKEYLERKAVFSEFPQDMLPELKGYLENAGIPRLYCHQAEMFERAQKKENLVITTSTASGKTLGFLLPVLQEILKNPWPGQFFIYPTRRWRRINTGPSGRWWIISGRTGSVRESMTGIRRPASGAESGRMPI